MVEHGGGMPSVPEIMQALERGQMFLEYQPVFPFRGPRRVAFEALLRWDHPVLGTIGPDEFLPAVHSPVLRAEITSFVIRQATEDCRRWVARGWDVGVAVNVWPADLLHPRVRSLLSFVTRTGLDPDRLTIELTEAACPLEDPRMTAGVIAVARLGVRLSLDDFGTGESSLVRLQQLQFDDLKIDRRFVTNAVESPTDRAIVRFSIQLAHALGMAAVVEGVEHPDCAALVHEFGADAVQGYLYAQPARWEDVSAPPSVVLA